jgi:hypothetical protein
MLDKISWCVYVPVKLVRLERKCLTSDLSPADRLSLTFGGNWTNSLIINSWLTNITLSEWENFLLNVWCSSEIIAKTGNIINNLILCKEEITFGFVHNFFLHFIFIILGYLKWVGWFHYWNITIICLVGNETSNKISIVQNMSRLTIH